MVWFLSSVCRFIHLSVSLFLVYAIKVNIFGPIFVKLTQFVHLIDSFNPIDFQKYLTVSMGKGAILSWKFAFLVYVIKSAFLVGFAWNLHSLSMLSIASTILILKKWENQYGKSRHFKLKNCNSCLRNKVYIFGRIFVKLIQFVYLINSLNPIDLKKKKSE